MPGQEQTTTVARDDLDDLFDYGHDPAEDEDLFKPTSTNFSAPASKTQSAKKTDDVLGIQDEIQVTKKRIPIPKLDESRYSLFFN